MSPIDRKAPAERRHEAGEHHHGIANARDREPRLVDGARLFACGMDRDAERGVAQHECGQDDDRDAEIEQPDLLEHRLAEQGNVAEHRRLPLRETRDLLARARRRRSRDRRAWSPPSTRMLMPMPVTIWFARSVTLRNACSAAIGATATTAMTRPISGLPVAQAPTAAAKAPVSIMPSRLMLSTPGPFADELADAGEQQRRREADRGADEDGEQLPSHRRLQVIACPKSSRVRRSSQKEPTRRA